MGEFITVAATRAASTINREKLRTEARAAFGAAYIDANETGSGATVTVYLTEHVANEQATWNSVVAAHNPTPIPVPIRDYAQSYIANAALWVKLHKALDDERHTFDISTATALTILAKAKAQLKAARAIIATAPQGVIDEFHRERVLMGSTTALPFTDAAIDLMLIGECRICINAIRLVANLGLAVVTVAYSLNE